MNLSAMEVEEVVDDVEEGEASIDTVGEQVEVVREFEATKVDRVYADMQIRLLGGFEAAFTISISVHGMPSEEAPCGEGYYKSGCYMKTEQLDYEIMRFIENALRVNVPYKRIRVMWEDDTREIYKMLYSHPIPIIEDEPASFLLKKLEDPYLWRTEEWNLMGKEIRLEGIRNGLLKQGVSEEDIRTMMEVRQRIGFEKLLKYALNQRRWYHKTLQSHADRILETLANGTSQQKVNIFTLPYGETIREFPRWVEHCLKNEGEIQAIAKELGQAVEYDSFHSNLNEKVFAVVDHIDIEALKQEAKKERARERAKEKRERDAKKGATNLAKLVIKL